MDPRNILNTEQIGRSPYNKMDEENQSQMNINQTGKVNILDVPQDNGRRCSWPHQWTLNECCCGCTLRTGCLLLGWFFMIGSALLVFGSISIPIPMLYRWEDLVFTCLKFISSVILLVGVYQHKLRMIRISVFLSLIDILVEIVLAIVLASQMGHLYPILVLFVGVPLAFYFLVVINSYANQMASGVYSDPPRMGRLTLHQLTPPKQSMENFKAQLIIKSRKRIDSGSKLALPEYSKFALPATTAPKL